MNQKVDFYKHVPRAFEDSGYNADKIAFVNSFVTDGLRVLDVGCSDGFIGSLFLKKHTKVYGLDIDKHKVRQSRKRGIKATVCDIETDKIPFTDNYFDFILLTDVIEHIFDTDRVLEEVHRVLKKRGVLLVTTPNIASLARRCMLVLGINPHTEYSSRYMDFLPGSVGHIRYYTRNNLRYQLTKNGFRNIVTHGDRVNFLLFSSTLAARLFPTLAVDILCTCKK